jgi:alkylation response protein AidB-like acyl-CoA dehydrogenase
MATDLEHVQTLCRQLLAERDPTTTQPEIFLGAQFDRGLAWVHFPEGHGGLGLSPSLQSTIDGELAAAGAAPAVLRNIIGHGMAAPTVVTHGTEEQRRRYLRPLFAGEEVWCQLFSEPGAGSDVAGLSTRAERDGDEWVVNGQKVWTTVAHVARWGLLVTRTDPDAKKHKGLTYFVLDMQTPGVEVRPLYQLTGEAEFNEVFFSDVRVADGQRLGEVGEGWRVVLTTLMNERVAVGGGLPRRGGGLISKVLDLSRVLPMTAVQRDRLTQLWVRAEVLRLTNIRAAQARHSGNPGPEGSIGKVISASLNQDICTFGVELLGADGMLKPGGYPMARTTPTQWENAQHAFLRARANSIEGGTTEIAKNILGERVLGLPGDVRTDRDVPWNQVPRNS